MPVTKRGGRWHYAFCIRGVRYRNAVPEARTKFEAERAETDAQQAVFEGRYGRPTGEHDFAKFVGNPDAENFAFEESTFLAWAKENGRSWRHDVFRARALVDFFRGKTFARISPHWRSGSRHCVTRECSSRGAATSCITCTLTPGVATRSSRSTEPCASKSVRAGCCARATTGPSSTTNHRAKTRGCRPRRPTTTCRCSR